MALPDFSMRQLLEAGVHFGHQKHRWNPKMAPYIYGIRNNIHIIDLAQTVPLLHRALQQVSDTVANGGRILFVGTKRQAAEPLMAAAKRSAQYYVNARWLGGTLTNWKTISRSIQRLRQLEQMLEGEAEGLTKKERLTLTRERDKLEKALGGIKDMGGVPDMVFVIDTNKEAIAIQEAHRLGIPVAAIVDSNCDPDLITLPIPGNDDAGRAITLYCDLIAKAAIDGIGRAQGAAGVDVGASESPQEPVVLEAAAAMNGDATMAAAETVEPQAAPRKRQQQAPQKPTPKLFTTPAGEPDDLKKITGIGPTLERKLNAMGITQYDQIAGLHRGGYRQGRRGAYPQGPLCAGRLGRPGPAARDRRARRTGVRLQRQAFLVSGVQRVNITAAMVKELRDKTGAGMMDCKSHWSRPTATWKPRSTGCAPRDFQGGKKTGRVAAEGVVAIASAPGRAAMVEVNSETDFVARNPDFQKLARSIAEAALATDGSLDCDHCGQASRRKDGRDGDRKRSPTSAKTSPSAAQRSYQRQGRRGRQLRPRCRGARARQDRRARRRRIRRRKTDTLSAFGKQVAMHIAAANPLAITRR